ncbi:hypothetical protein [Nocardia sp. SSK8]|uniref:hypothetical protein n=1 Tax=Nocardia sp. SSK8 TaxID=3120154 RepID=UPI0030085D2D
MRRSIRLPGLAVAALTTLLLSGCAETSNWESLERGDCGYFTYPGGTEPWNLEQRDCADPEAALIVIRAASTEQCADHSFSASRIPQKGRTRYVCTSLNAQVGDCYNNIDHQYAHLYKLRKVPCSTPGSAEVTARTDTDDLTICGTTDPANSTTIRHKSGPVSFCLTHT